MSVSHHWRFLVIEHLIVFVSGYIIDYRRDTNGSLWIYMNNPLIPQLFFRWFDAAAPALLIFGILGCLEDHHNTVWQYAWNMATSMVLNLWNWVTAMRINWNRSRNMFPFYDVLHQKMSFNKTGFPQHQCPENEDNSLEHSGTAILGHWLQDVSRK